MSTQVAETPTTPTPSSFHHPAPAAVAAHHHQSATATPKPIYIPPSVSPAAPELRHVTSHTKVTAHTTSKSGSGKLAPPVDGHKTPSGLSPNHIPATLNLSPATHPARLGSRSSSSIPSSPNSVYVRSFSPTLLNLSCAYIGRPCPSLQHSGIVSPPVLRRALVRAKPWLPIPVYFHFLCPFSHSRLCRSEVLLHFLCGSPLGSRLTETAIPWDVSPASS